MKIDLDQKIIFIMGVSGSGKTVVGQLLAHELGVPFIDADDHHPMSNIEKMSQGIPLNDKDRKPWLDILHDIAVSYVGKGCVIACSALKEIYRSQLSHSIKDKVLWVYLKGSYQLIFERMNHRKDHFMGAEMLQSQFDVLEEPTYGLKVDISDAPKIIIQKIQDSLIQN